MSQSITPRIEINLEKIAHNVETLVQLYGLKGIEIMGVTKGVCGEVSIANTLVSSGILILADSKIQNIMKMRDAKIKAQYVLLRTPALSEVDVIVKYADISMNTEISVIKALSASAKRQKVVHKIILMIEMGDLREGILPIHLKRFIQEISHLTGIKIVGIGANFACFGGVKPSEANMKDLSALACTVEKEFSLSLSYISGGNSGNYHWYTTTENVGRINNLRIGEAIYLGCETLDRMPISELFTDALTFVSEVIECKIKPSVPYGDIGQDTFGNVPHFEDRGEIKRVILGVGSQDVLVAGLIPMLDIEILGSSSDHMLLDAKNTNLKVGDEVKFNISYGALLSLMTSPYVFKKYLHVIDRNERFTSVS